MTKRLLALAAVAALADGYHLLLKWPSCCPCVAN